MCSVSAFLDYFQTDTVACRQCVYFGRKIRIDKYCINFEKQLIAHKLSVLNHQKINMLLICEQKVGPFGAEAITESAHFCFSYFSPVSERWNDWQLRNLPTKYYGCTISLSLVVTAFWWLFAKMFPWLALSSKNTLHRAVLRGFIRLVQYLHIDPVLRNIFVVIFVINFKNYKKTLKLWYPDLNLLFSLSVS